MRGARRSSVTATAATGSYEAICRTFVRFSPSGRSRRELSPWQYFCAGGAASCVAWSIVFPADSIKSVMQNSQLSLRQTVAAFCSKGRAIRKKREKSMMEQTF
ncbi:MAG: hypothetical protein HN333_15840 [Rhodospirillaceae bacterium]|nr:hypothetical protein [Rhodospirillaceae bacterium]